MRNNAPRLASLRTFLVLVLLLVPVGAAWAAPEDDPAVEAVTTLIDQGKSVKARDTAEAFFKRDGGTYASYYVLGKALKECEGNLQRARYCLVQARALIEQRYGSTGPERARDMHLDILEQLAFTCEEMDMYEEALEVLEAHDRLVPKDRLYKKLSSLYGWPLMKLGRYDEARLKMQEVYKKGNSSIDRTNALNTLAVIDLLTGHYQDAYEKALVYLRMEPYDSTLLGNAGEICLCMQRFEDAIRYFSAATDRSWPPGVAHGYEFLTLIFTAENRLRSAIEAVKNMHKWEHSKGFQPDDAQQVWAEFRFVSAALLLVLGKEEHALDMTWQMLVRPDRRGNKSMDANQWEINLLLLHLEALKARAERLSEEMAWCGLRDWVGNAVARMEISRQLWTARSRVAAVMFGANRLDWTLRPYGPDSLLPEWIRPEVSETLGYGVATRQFDILLARTDGEGQRERAHLLAAKGEALLRAGSRGPAVEALLEAVNKLPRHEELLRARCRALLAQIWDDEGDRARAAGELVQVMETFPALVRVLGLSLPAAIEASDDPAAREAASRLERSPRFHSSAGGFTVRVAATPEGLTASLAGPDGRVLRTVTTAGSGSDLVPTFCREFHDRVFAPDIEFDISEIDGTSQSQESVRNQTTDLVP